MEIFTHLAVANQDPLTNREVINLILQNTAELVTYMLPILGVLTALVFMLSLLYSWTFGAAKNIR